MMMMIAKVKMMMMTRMNDYPLIYKARSIIYIYMHTYRYGYLYIYDLDLVHSLVAECRCVGAQWH